MNLNENDQSKKNEILVSIVVPVHNSEKYLVECLDSILRQTMTSFELLCVDDGSTDGSLAILQKYAALDTRIKILQQSNKGAGAARNLGMDQAIGKYLLFLDSDDIFDRRLIELSLKRAEDTLADIVIYAVQQFDSATGKIIPCGWAFQKKHYPNPIFNYKDNPAMILRAFQLCPWNKLFSRSFIVNNKLRWQEISRTNDFLFCSKAMICAERIALVDTILVNYRVNNDNSLQASNEKAPLDFYKAVKAFYDYLLETDKLKDIEESYYWRALRVCLYNLEKNTNEDAKAYIFEFLKHEGFAKLGLIEYIKANPNKLAEEVKYHSIADKKITEGLFNIAKLEQDLTDANDIINSLNIDNNDMALALEETNKSLINLKKIISNLEADKKALLVKQNEISKNNKELLTKQAEINQQNKELITSLEAVKNEKNKQIKKIKSLENSKDYRLGRFLLYIPRRIKKIFRP